MMQKLHGWLQPSAIFKYAKCFGVRRKRGVAKSGMKTGRAVTSKNAECGVRSAEWGPMTVLVLPNFSEPRRDSSFRCSVAARLFSNSFKLAAIFPFDGGRWMLNVECSP